MYFSVVLGLVFVVFNLQGVACLAINRTCEIGWIKQPNSNDCYRFFPATLSWKDASNSCIGQNSMLAVINDAQTNNFVTKNVTKGYRSWIGLNDRNKPNHWEWSVIGSSTRYTNWAPGEPNNGFIFGSENCVEIEDASGKWNDETCSSARPYVCQKSLGCDPTRLRGLNNNSSNNGSLMAVGTKVIVDVACVTGYRPVNKTAETVCQMDGTWSTENFHCKEIYCNTPSTKIPNALTYVHGKFPYSIGSKVAYSCKSGFMLLGNDQSTCRDLSLRLSFGVWDQPPLCVRAPKCDDGWTQLNFFCYKYVQNLTSWKDADKTCQTIGGSNGRLVSISNRFENDLVKSLGNDSSSLWIGFHDKPNEDVWEWSDGTSVRYKNFKQGEPNNGQFWWDDDEDCVEMDTSTGEWNDESCSNLRDFVCEKPLGS